MIKDVIFYHFGTGQKVVLASQMNPGAASIEEKVLLIAPRALHASWGQEMGRAGVDSKCVSMCGPEQVLRGTVSLDEFNRVYVDELHPGVLLKIGSALRDAAADVTVLTSLEEYLRCAHVLEATPQAALDRLLATLADRPCFVRCDQSAFQTVLGVFHDAGFPYDLERGGVEGSFTAEMIKAMLDYPGDFRFYPLPSMDDVIQAQSLQAAQSEPKDLVTGSDGPTIH